MIFEAKQIKKIKEMINTRFPLCAAIMSFFIFPLVFFIICTVSLLIGMLSGGIDAIVGLIMIFCRLLYFSGTWYFNCTILYARCCSYLIDNHDFYNCLYLYVGKRQKIGFTGNNF